MKIISWNIRGLNGRSKQKMLRELILVETPDVVLLQETKCTSEDIDRLLPYCWRQGGAVSIDATGTAGGLAILWNTNVVLMENFRTTRWSITADYRLIGSNKPGHLTSVYGPASPRDKQAFLRSLSYLSSLTQYNRWIVGGDFNIIRSLKEKKGGSRRLDRDSCDFNSLIDDLRLIDLEASNDIHTWTNRRRNTSNSLQTRPLPHFGISHDGRHCNGIHYLESPWFRSLAHTTMVGCPSHSWKETLPGLNSSG
jgi:exonuclease III